tara:strand:- start:1658 stop:2014 length:357 start_codon:yes stop_codon:yes gene_type:complete
MKRFLFIAICLATASCGTKTILYQEGVADNNGNPIKLAEFGNNATGVQFVSGNTSLSADTFDMATSTAAQNAILHEVVASAQSIMNAISIAKTVDKVLDTSTAHKSIEVVKGVAVENN